MNAHAQITRPTATKDKALTLLIAYLAVEYLRLHEIILPFLAPLKIPMFLVIALLFIVVKKWKSIPKDGVIIAVFIFYLQMLVWVPFATNNYFAFQTVKSMSLIFITMLSIVAIVNTHDKLLTLLKAWVVIQSFMSIWVIVHGGKGPGGFVADENDVCFVLVASFPFAWYLARNKQQSKRLKWFSYLTCVLITVGVITTYSRGGFLGYIVMISAILIYSERRIRNTIVILVFALTFGTATLHFLPDKYVSDMETITDKKDTTRNLRFLHWTTAWEMFKDNPLFGVGPANYPWDSIRYFYLSPYYDPHQRGRTGRVAHSMYFTLIPEFGMTGIALFLYCFMLSWRRMTRIKKSLMVRDVAKSVEEKPVCQLCRSSATIIQTAIAGSFTAGAFISVLYYPLIWHLLGLSLAVFYNCGLKQQNTEYTL